MLKLNQNTARVFISYCAVIFVAVINHEDLHAQAPIIESVELSADKLVNGGDIKGTIRVRSDLPVKFLSKSLTSPIDSIYEGSTEAVFIEDEPGMWVHEWTDTISASMPSGVYAYSRIRVTDAAQIDSDYWPVSIFTVDNSVVPEIPVIESVQLSSDELVNGGNIKVTIRVRSNVPVDF